MNPAARQNELEPAATTRQPGGVPVESKRLHQPKASLCWMLAVLWIFPSAGAVVILGAGEANWLKAHGFIEGLRAVAFEQWIALAILAGHLLFASLAWRFRRTEPWREVDPDANSDPGLREVP